MPTRRRTRKSRKPKSVYRKRGYRKRTYRKKGAYVGDTMVYKGIGIADQFFTKLKYVENVTIAGTTLVPYKVYQFEGNDLFDLNNTGGGGQCQYYDQICNPNALYKRYMVTASKIKLRCSSNSDSVASGNIDICLTPSQQPYSSVGWLNIDDQLCEKDTHTTSVVRYDNGGVKYLKHFAKTKRVIDVKDMRDNMQDVSAYSDARPNNRWYWIIGAQGMDRSSTSWTMTVRAEITVYVMFYTPTDPTMS